MRVLYIILNNILKIEKLEILRKISKSLGKIQKNF